MHTHSIVPPFPKLHIPLLLKTPVALYVKGVEEKRGNIIKVNLHPDGGYMMTLTINVGNGSVWELGFDEIDCCWYPVHRDLMTNVMCTIMNPEIFDVRHATGPIQASMACDSAGNALAT